MALPGRLISAVGRLAAQFRAWLKPVVGSISWSRPPWIGVTAAHLRRHPREYGGGIAAALFAVVVGYAGYQWYIHRPHPPEPEKLTFTVAAPELTTYETANGTP